MDEVMNKIFSLVEGRIGAHVTSFSPIAMGAEMYRITFEIYTNPQKRNLKLWFYEIWLSREYLEDTKGLQREPTQEEYLDFAIDFLRKRWKENGDFAPAEEGAYLTNITGELLGNPRTFSSKTSESEKVSLQKTTILLPTDAHRWLKEYAAKSNTSIGDLVRRVVTGFIEERKKPKSEK